MREIFSPYGDTLNQFASIDDGKFVYKDDGILVGRGLNGNLDVIADSGNLYAGTSTTISNTQLFENDASWEVNQFVNKIVKITRNGDCDRTYAIIASNTVDRLIFDDDIEDCPDICDYEIIDSLVLTDADMDSIVAFVVLNSNVIGVILPESTAKNERKRFHLYIENSANGNEIPVIAKGTDRIFGAKLLTLNKRTEGITIYAHQLLMPHWDILSVYNVQRYAIGLWEANESISSETTEWQEIGVDTSLIYRNEVDNRNLARFAPHPDINDFNYVRYTDLLPKKFKATLNILVTKTGSAGDVNISLKKKDKDGIETEFTNYKASTRFGGGTGTTTISVSIPMDLNYRDEILPIVERTGGNYVIEAGSTLIIEEL